MKVLHILDERWDSGLTGYGLGVARALKKLGHEVWIAARPEAPAERQARAEGVAVLGPAQALALRRAAGKISFDVVNAHTGTGHVAGWWASRFRSAALVRSRGEARALSVRPGQGLLYRSTDGVIAASQQLAEAYLRAFPFVGDRLTVIPPGVDLPPERPLPSGPLRWGVLGRLDPVKGHGVLLEAIALMKDRLTDDIFCLAGQEKGLRRSDLESTARRLGIAKWVDFPGWVPDAGAWMDTCHVGIIPSVDSEAVSRVALEWMSHGRPLVATAVGALPELVLNGDNGYLVPPRQPAGLARVLTLLREDADRRKKMGERSRRTVETRFTLDRWGRQTEQAYQTALERRRRQR